MLRTLRHPVLLRVGPTLRFHFTYGDRLPLESWPDHYFNSAGLWIKHQCTITS